MMSVTSETTSGEDRMGYCHVQMDLLVCLRVLLRGNFRVREILPKARAGKGK